MESRGWHVTLLQIMLLLVLLALPAAADCTWDSLTDYTFNYEGAYSSQAYKASFKDGEKAPYKCQDGYLPSSQYSGPRILNATCRGDHWEWDARNLQCRQVVCPQPTPIADGKVDPPQGIFREDATVQYTCNQGFTLNGDATRRCQNNATWSGNDPTCEQRCPEPKPLPHGEIKTNRIYEIGAIIIYVCDDGQRSSATCGEDLKWRPEPPSCTDTKRQTVALPPSPPLPTTTTTTTTTTPLPPTQCSPLPSPTYGKLFSKDGFRINASVFFTCDEGYALHGPAKLVCQTTGIWDPAMMPTCTAPPPWIIILSVCLAVLASLVLCCLGFFYFMRRRRRSTPPPRNYRRQIRKPGPYDAISNDEVARLGKPLPVTSL
uniref:Membrane cofactor protein-like isoform X5 n=1 Tax=Rhipicephalus appendiculatus TaxID=34631 RepID=A0A131YGX9_RHIAP